MITIKFTVGKPVWLRGVISLEFIGYLLFIAGFLGFFVSIAFIVRCLVVKKRKSAINWLKILGGCVLAFFAGAIMIGSTVGSSASTDSKPSKSQAAKRESKKEKSAKKSSEKAAKISSKKLAESSSKAAKSSSRAAAKASSKRAKIVQLESNYNSFLKSVADVPTTSQGTIPQATYDPNTATLTLQLTDEALGATPAQLRALTKEAWDAGQRLIQQAGQMPESKNPLYVTVTDSAGDELAKSSFLGSYKYEGDN